MTPTQDIALGLKAKLFRGFADPRMEDVLRAVEAVLADVAGQAYACVRYHAEGGADGDGC